MNQVSIGLYATSIPNPSKRKHNLSRSNPNSETARKCHQCRLLLYLIIERLAIQQHPLENHETSILNRYQCAIVSTAWHGEIESHIYGLFCFVAEGGGGKLNQILRSWPTWHLIVTNENIPSLLIGYWPWIFIYLGCHHKREQRIDLVFDRWVVM